MLELACSCSRQPCTAQPACPCHGPMTALIKPCIVFQLKRGRAGPKAPVRLEGTSMTHLRFTEDGTAQPAHPQGPPAGGVKPPMPPPPTTPGGGQAPEAQLPSPPPTTNKSAAQRLRDRLLGAVHAEST